MIGLRRGARAHRVAIVRDVVEIVALIAAGAWAFYTFAYEQRIKPAAEPPRINLTGTLRKVGTRNGLTALLYNVEMRNSGDVPFTLIAEGFTASGARFEPIRGAARTVEYGIHHFWRDAKPATPRTIYRRVQLMRLAGVKHGGSYTLQPGVGVGFSEVFLVRRADYDEVVLDASVAFTKRPTGEYPLTLREYPVTVIFDSKKSDVETEEAPVATAMLW